MLHPLICDKCGQPAKALVDVLVSRQTHWSPAEYEEWCGVCAVDPDYEAEQRSLKGYSDEERERI